MVIIYKQFIHTSFTHTQCEVQIHTDTFWSCQYKIISIYFWWSRCLIFMDDCPPTYSMKCSHSAQIVFLIRTFFSCEKYQQQMSGFPVSCSQSQHKAFFSALPFSRRQAGASVQQNTRQPSRGMT